MTNQEIENLLERHLSNLLTIAERKELMAALDQLSDEQIVHILGNIKTPGDYMAEISEKDSVNRLERIQEKLFERNNIKPIGKDYPKKGIRKLIGRIAAAVCLCVAVGWSVYHWMGRQEADVLIVAELTDIDPAEPIALITLSNGETIRVDSASTGLLYSKNGLGVYKGDDGEIVYRDSTATDDTPSYLTIHTPKGGFTKLKLDDGTLVQLNAASFIRYPTSFESGKRDVFVEGEAFFDVKPNKDRPFRVHSAKQIVEVLGTSFNLSTNEQYAKTTLIEGSVKIVSEGKDYFLKPGQQSLVADGVEIKDINTMQPIAWKNEKFIFDNSSFIEALREVENWYDVKMVFYDQDLDNVQLSGTVSRNVKLSELLKVLEMNTNYKFEIKGRRVLVRRY